MFIGNLLIQNFQPSSAYHNDPAATLVIWPATDLVRLVSRVSLMEWPCGLAVAKLIKKVNQKCFASFANRRYTVGHCQTP
jgi:hypothetical protein